MKLKDFKQAMDWRRRVGFNGGGYVKKKVLPQPKPKEEAEKVNKARKEKTFEKAKPALENPKEVKEMIDKPKRGLVDEPGSYAGKEQYKDPKRAKARKKIFIDAYGQEAFDNLSRGDKSKVTAGDRDPLKVGTGQTGNPKTIYEPYRKEALKAFEKFKKSGKPFAALDIAEEAVKKMKGKKGAIKNINIEQLAQNLTRSFFTEEQRKFFDVQGSKVRRVGERLAPKRIIFEKMIKGDSNIKSLMKATNLSKQKVENIIRNISNTDIPKAKKEIALGQDVQNVVLRDFKLKDFDTFRASFASEPTLQITNKKAITELVTDAYRNQPKKLKRALTRIKAYFKVANQLKEAGLNLNLDHPLARSIIEDMSKVEPEQLIRVSPLPQDINIGIKGQQFDRVYRDIINNLQVRNLSTEDRKKLLTQKKALETLSTDLNIPFGKMSQRGRIINFGTPEFLKQDLPKEIRSAINFKTKFKNALDSFEPQVLKERVMAAFDVTEDKANNLINQFKTVAKEKNPQKYFNILKGIFKKDAGSILKGLKADASDALNLVSEAIFPTLQAAEVLPSEAQAAIPKPMNFDLDMSLPPKQESIFKNPYVSGATAATAGLSFPKTRPFTKKALGIGIRGIGTPPVLLGEIARQVPDADYSKASDRIFPEVTAAFAKDAVSLGQGLAKQAGKGIRSLGDRVPFVRKAEPFVRKNLQRLLLSSPMAFRAARVLNPIGQLALLGEGALGYGKFVKSELDRIKAMTPEQREQYNAAEQEQMGIAAAGGGLLKQAGDRSGKPPEAGPNSQGLDFLMKRGR